MTYPVCDLRGHRRLDRDSWYDPALAQLYGMGARAYKALHDGHLLPRRRVSLPVISIGALTAGGSGKTPFVRWLAARLLRAGLQPAILSRGYGGREVEKPRLVDPERPDALRDGDEPSLLARTLREVPVIVGADRAESAALAKGRGARVFLLDDGFQHRRLERDLDVVLWDRTAERSRGRLIPRGALREPVSALGRADAVVLVDRGEGPPEPPRRVPEERLFRARLRPVARQPLREGTPVHALSGVANPASFEHSLERLGLRVCGATRFPDHHAFKKGEILAAVGRARREGADHLAVTAKDHARWPRGMGQELPTPAVFDLDAEMESEERFFALIESTLGVDA